MLLPAGVTAVITGVAQDIGYAITKSSGAEGARVVLGDPGPEATKVAVKEFGDPSKVGAVWCEVTNSSDADALLQAVVEGRASLDVMVGKAGTTYDATTRTMSEERFDPMIDVHLEDTRNGTPKTAAITWRQKSGVTVNLLPLWGKVRMAGQIGHSVPKGGIAGRSKASAREPAHHGVRVNAIEPRLIRTATTEAMPHRTWAQKMQETPARRAGEVGEAAPVGWFLASNPSSSTTGTALEATGGRFMA